MVSHHHIRLKVCGMRLPRNIEDVDRVGLDFIGFIFYPGSPRYVETIDNQQVIETLDNVIKVGVFVNEKVPVILEKVNNYRLNMVQLHGQESPQVCKALQEQGLKVIKVFSVMDKLPLEQMVQYEESVDYFLFDTKTPGHGGSGQKFDWEILKEYNLPTPFFLSGGITLDDIATIHQLGLPTLVAIDVNSRFELEPGLKDVTLIKKLKEALPRYNENVREVQG